METLKDLWNNACLAADIPAISIDTCARILAVVYVHGNNESFVCNHSFISDVKYIQTRFGISGGETPNADFSVVLRQYIKELEDYELEHKDDEIKSKSKNEAVFKSHIPQWAVNLFQERYNIKLIN